MGVIIVTIEITGPYFIMMACGYLKSNKNRLLAMADESSSIVQTDEEKSLNQVGKMVVKEQLSPNKWSAMEVVTCIKFHQKILE